MELNLDTLIIFVIWAVIWWTIRQTLDDLPGEGPHRPRSSNEGPDKTAGEVVRKSGQQPFGQARAKDDDGPDGRLNDIRHADRTFETGWFLENAGIVYETVIAAFAQGDRAPLRDLVAADVYNTFSRAIAERESRGEQVELAFIGLKRNEIVDAAIFNGSMQITVFFESELVTVTRNAAGVIVAGDPARVTSASDLWTFTKDVGPTNLIWRLAATESPYGQPAGGNHAHLIRDAA